MKPIVFTLSLLIILSCGKNDGTAPVENSGPESATREETTLPIDFKDVNGTWLLKYKGNYGYRFSFNKNYKSLIILYLGSQVLIFKGVYTIEGSNLIRINIFEMKREEDTGRINVYRGFVKTKSSYFIFFGYCDARKNRRSLILKPGTIFIDGNSSDGYFEPLIKLNKI